THYAPALGWTPSRNISVCYNQSSSICYAANCASEYTATWKSPMPQGNVGHWSRRPSAPLYQLRTARAILLLEPFCVIGPASSVRSHHVGRRAERTTRRIEHCSSHLAWRGCLWQ